VRPIYIAQLDKARPVVVLTRELVRDSMTSVTVAPITTRVRGLYSEVPVGTENNLSEPGIISCDNIQTISSSDLGNQIGWLLPQQEKALADAISHAFDLDM
jgi:mRNA interferase MazF